MTPSFAYHLILSIKFGCSLASTVGEEITSIGAAKRVLLISDPGVIKAGLADALIDSLKRNGLGVDLFSDLNGEASTACIERVAKLLRTAKPSAVIGLGGGSALDVAKLATVLSAGDGGAEYCALMTHPLPHRTAKLIMLAGMGAQAFDNFTRQSGIEISLKKDGLCADDSDRIVAAALGTENTPIRNNNCYPASEADIREFARQLLSQ
jgi:alcohol dehydrogenase class IV